MPVLTKAKIPIIDNWSVNASSDISKIVAWDHMYPACNWGLLTGENMFVVDIDPDKEVN
jgi:hypothetical protein